MLQRAADLGCQAQAAKCDGVCSVKVLCGSRQSSMCMLPTQAGCRSSSWTQQQQLLPTRNFTAGPRRAEKPQQRTAGTRRRAGQSAQAGIHQRQHPDVLIRE